MRFKIIIITIITIFLFSCELKDVYDGTLKGDGNIVESSIILKTYKDITLFSQTSIFNGIKNTKINVIKSNDNRVEIKTDKNILDNFEIENTDNYFGLYNINEFNYYDFTSLEITIYIPNIEFLYNGIRNSDLYVSNFDNVEKFDYRCTFSSNLYLPESFSVNKNFTLFIIDEYSYKDFNIFGVKSLIANEYIFLSTKNGYYAYHKINPKINYPDLENIKSKSITILCSSISENIVIEADSVVLKNPSYNSEVHINSITTTDKLELYGGINCNNISAKTIRLDSEANAKIVTAIESFEVTNLNAAIDRIESPLINLKSTGSFEIKELITDNLDLNISGYNNGNTIILPELTNIDTLNIVLENYNLDLKGSVNNLNVTMVGYYTPAILDCSNLITKNANINLANSKKAHINVTEKLTYTIENLSELIYQGTNNIDYMSSTIDFTSTLTYLGE